MGALQMHMYSVHPHQDSEIGFHLGYCLGFVDKNMLGNHLLCCDLAEIYYLLFAIQVNALALQFTNLLLILALCLLDFCFFISS